MWLRFFCFFTLLVISNCLVETAKDIDVPRFANEIEKWAESNNETETFKDLIRSLRMPTELQNVDWRMFSAEPSIAICTICQSVVSSFMKLRSEGMSEKDIIKRVTKLCVSLNIQNERVCKGAIELNLPIVIYIIDSRPNLSAGTICGVILESKSCPLKDLEFDWSINIPNKSNVEFIANENDGHTNILQISDIHYDPVYESNGNSNCGEPVCCRKGQNVTGATSLAGFWGDYNSCDTPWHAVVDALTHIKVTHQDIDFMYFTGDIIDHGVWETTKEGNIQSITKVYNKIHKIFNGTVMYPIFGNHEPHPLNQFAPKDVTRDYLTTNWLYSLMADLWINYGWLPESTRSTILQGGYYTVSPKKGFRVIALNSNVCYSYNWWLLYNPKDPDNQLQWLVNTLLEAERNQEYVHILSHIPVTGNNCLKTWKREYLRIMDRFSHVIKAEFNGHTHNDEIGIFYNSDNQAKTIAWNGGSVTTYTKLNPNYKIYTVNNRDYAVLDYQNWMYNLSLANENSHVRPSWYKSYSFKAEYGLSDLTVKSMSDWFYKSIKNETVLTKYYMNHFKHAEPSLNGNCNVSCKQQYFCRIIAHTEDDFCDKIINK